MKPDIGSPRPAPKMRPRFLVVHTGEALIPLPLSRALHLSLCWAWAHVRLSASAWDCGCESGSCEVSGSEPALAHHVAGLGSGSGPKTEGLGFSAPPGRSLCRVIRGADLAFGRGDAAWAASSAPQRRRVPSWPHPSRRTRPGPAPGPVQPGPEGPSPPTPRAPPPAASGLGSQRGGRPPTPKAWAPRHSPGSARQSPAGAGP